MRPKLRSSLYLVALLPQDSFVKFVSDRMACGLAIIVRSSYYYFKGQDEWKFLGDTFDDLSNFELARGLVFDGIASTIEYAIPPNPTKDLDAYEAKLKEKPALSIPACNALQRNLFKYIYGAYHKDFSLCVPAMLCLEKVYRHLSLMLLILKKNDKARDPSAPVGTVPDVDLWHRVAVALYSVCGSLDVEASKHGWECFQRVVLSTVVDDVPDEKWIAFLTLISSKYPPVTAEVSRVNTFSVFGQLMIRVLPSLTQRQKNWKPLTDITKNFAVLADENLRDGRSIKALFEYTLQTVTFLSNKMASPDFAGDKRYSAWASETLLTVLEKNGAGGGASKNKALTKKGKGGGANGAVENGV